MNHLMVDLETLGTRVTSVICSIGAVVFNEDQGIVGEFYRNCSWQDQVQHQHRTIDEGTLRWWLQQSDEARAALSATPPIPLGGALGSLTSFYTQWACERAWANGASFDIAILDHALSEYPLLPIWKYNAPRDMRTLRDLVPPDLGDDIPKGVAHNALDDARWQAEWTLRALHYLRGTVKA